jgi:glycosyltransferase involved in cell wall biosynthesis
MASFRARLRFPHDGYFVVCQYLANQLGAVGVADNRVYDVRNAVDTERFHPEKVPEPLDDRFRRRLGALDDRPRLGFVGGLHPEKGLNDLAAAVERMTTDPVVVVAGDGPERFQLEAQFGSAGKFLGAVSYEQMPALYHEFDAFVLPSHTEGLPRVVLEAQATGTPVVATRVGGVPEVVSEGETGRLVDPGEPIELASVLNPLLTDEAECRRLGDNGRAAIESDLSWNALYDRYERYLSRLVE